MAITKKQFLEDVAKEATALKEYATEKELSKLDFESFCPTSKTSCIYGQITGNCKSKRASELIFNCCKRFVRNTEDVDVDFQHLKKAVNGEKIDGAKTLDEFHHNQRSGWDIVHFSSIEAYIMLPNAKNKNLIDFIKGEKEKLVL